MQSKKNEIAAILWNIRSIHNVASIFRTADAAGIKKIYLCGITPSPVDRFRKILPQFAKISLGAEHTVSWEPIKSQRATLALIKKLKADGYKIFSVEQSRRSTPYYKVRPFDTAQGKNQNKIALIFGNEVRGLPPSILKASYKILEIPVGGAMVRQAHHPRRSGRGKESLNVAVVFGIVAYGFSINSRFFRLFHR